MTSAGNRGSSHARHGAPTAQFLAIVGGRRGHFLLESGHHSNLWLDLDALFAQPPLIDPFVESLADALRPHEPEVVCGPLLGGAFVAQLVARSLSAEFCFTERRMPVQGQGLFRASYTLPAAFHGRLHGRRVAMVDDVMSAGSALRGTHAELLNHGAIPISAGALLVLGTTGASYFAERGIPVEAPARGDHELWLPGTCPRCAEGVPLEDPAPPFSP